MPRRVKPIGSDFEEEILTAAKHCSECGNRMPFGAIALTSWGRNGKVAKRVCSEECRLTFDNNFWQEVARKRSSGERDRRP